jgi:3-ketosteroid 9alpha-monooxygenase subunit B
VEGPYHALRVAKVVQETADARSLVLDVPEPLRERFAYRSGQFLTFRVPAAGGRVVRCYSLASAPGIDGEWKVTVKRVAGGRASAFLNESVRAGDVLEVMPPAGRFCLAQGEADLVLFGGGSGITPLISLLKTALAGTDRRVRLLYANRDRDSIIFRAELEEWARRHPGRLEVVHRLDALEGFADASAVRAFVGEPRDSVFYICGPGPYMDVVEGALLGVGVPRERIFIERFEYAHDGTPQGAAAPADAGAAAGGSRAVVRLDGAEREIEVRPGETVVQAARRAGLEPPTSCEEGYCACCMAQLREGSGQMKANDVLTSAQLAEGWVLTCQLVPTSPRLRIDYPD